MLLHARSLNLPSGKMPMNSSTWSFSANDWTWAAFSGCLVIGPFMWTTVLAEGCVN